MVDLFTGLTPIRPAGAASSSPARRPRFWFRRRSERTARDVDRDLEQQHALFERMMLALLDCPLPIIAAVTAPPMQADASSCWLSAFAYAVPHRQICTHRSHESNHAGGGGTQDFAATESATPRRRNHHDRRTDRRRAGLRLGMVNRLCARKNSWMRF